MKITRLVQGVDSTGVFISEAIDRVGLLKDITSLLSDERINISGSMTENKDGNSYITFYIYVKSMSQLNSVFTKIENIKSVLNVKRLK